MSYKIFCLLLIFKISVSITEEQIKEFEKEYTSIIFKFDENLRNKIILSRNDNKIIEFSDEEIQILLINGLPFFPKEINMLKSIARSFINNVSFYRVVCKILYSINFELLKTITVNVFKELEIEFSQTEKNFEYVNLQISKLKLIFLHKIRTSDLKKLNEIYNQNKTAGNIKAFFYQIFNTLKRQYENDHVEVKLKNELKRILEKIQLDIEEIICEKVCHLEDLFFEAAKNDFKEFEDLEIRHIIHDLQKKVFENDKNNLSDNLQSLCFGLQNIIFFFYKLSESYMIKIVFKNCESLILCQIDEENKMKAASESQDKNEISEIHSKQCPFDFLSLSENKMLLIIKAEKIKNFMFLQCYNLGFLFFSMNVEHFLIENYFFFKHIAKLVFNIEKYISFDNFVLPQTLEDLENKKFLYNINEKSSKQINNLLDNFERFIKFNTENTFKEFYIQIDDYICFHNRIEFLPSKNFIFKNQLRFAYLRYYLHSLYFYARIPEFRKYIKIEELERFYNLLTPKYANNSLTLVEIDSFIENSNKQFLSDCKSPQVKIDNQNEPNKILPVFLECFRLFLELSDLSNLYFDNLILFGQYNKIQIRSKTGKISGIIIGDFIYFSLSKNLNYNFPVLKHLPYIFQKAQRGFHDKYLKIRGKFDIDLCFYNALVVKSKSKDEFSYLNYEGSLFSCKYMIIELYELPNIWVDKISFFSCIFNRSQYSEHEVARLDRKHYLKLQSYEKNIPLKISNFKSLYIHKCKFNKDIILEISLEQYYNFDFMNSEFIMDFNGLKIKSSNVTEESDEIESPELKSRNKNLIIRNCKCTDSLFHNKFKFERIEIHRCNISFTVVLDLKVTLFLLFDNCIGNISFSLNDLNYDFGKIEFKENSVFEIKKIDDNYSFKFENIDFKKSYKDFFEINQNCSLVESNA